MKSAHPTDPYTQRSTMPAWYFFMVLLPFVAVFDWFAEYVLDLIYLVPYFGLIAGVAIDLISFIFMFFSMTLLLVLGGALNSKSGVAWALLIGTALFEFVSLGAVPGWTALAWAMYTKSKAADIVYNRKVKRRVGRYRQQAFIARAQRQAERENIARTIRKQRELTQQLQEEDEQNGYAVTA